MSQPEPSIGATIYEDAASIGRFRAWIGLAIAGFIGLILFGYGVKKLYSGNKYTASVKGESNGGCGPEPTSSPTSKTSPTSPIYNCPFMYSVNNQVYYKTFQSSTPYSAHQIETVYYDPSNPSDSSLTGDISGWYFIIGAVVIVAIAYFVLWLSQRYKFFAAAEGVGMAGNVVRNMW
jgi:hypothetical protein